MTIEKSLEDVKRQDVKNKRDQEITAMEAAMWRLERQIDNLKAQHNEKLKRHQQLMQQMQKEEAESKTEKTE